LGHVILGEAAAGQVREHVIRFQNLTDAHYNRQAHLFSQSVVLDGEGGGTFDKWMSHSQLFDTRRVNVVTAANNQILLSSDDHDQPVFVDDPEVAAHEPAVNVEGSLRGHLIAEVAQHQ